MAPYVKLFSPDVHIIAQLVCINPLKLAKHIHLSSPKENIFSLKKAFRRDF